MLLRGKNATGGTDGKTEKASIGELRRSLIDTLTKEHQVASESAIIERTQFHMDRGGIAHDATRESEKRNQPEPSRMRVRSREIAFTHPHPEIRQCHFAHRH